MPSEAVRNQCLFLGAIGRTSSRQEGGFTGLDFSGFLDIAGKMGLAGRLHWVVHNKGLGVSLAGRQATPKQSCSPSFQIYFPFVLSYMALHVYKG